MRFNFDALLISAFMDRWRPETHKFHLLVGEMTLSLEDAAMLGGRCRRPDVRQVSGGLPALAVRVGAVLRVSGRLRVAIHDPLGSEDHRRTPRVDAPDQLGQRCSGSYLQGGCVRQ
jgi:hypothetical protein